MVTKMLLLTSVLFSLCINSAFVSPPTVVDGAVSYVGALKEGTESFQNIKYGQDTGGKNRFKQPKACTYQPGVVNASLPGAACPQVVGGNPAPQLTGLFGNVTEVSEDCLSIRIDRPVNTEHDDQLPVMVYLYGMGFSMGSIYDDVAYDPAGLVREGAKKGLGVIYVGINYRVGVFGFAASRALRDESNMNLGLSDQQLGLRWIQAHITAFGGNKDNVTIYGENVGWTSVQLQLTAHGGRQGGRPLFHRAILQSGPTMSGDALTSGLTDTNTASLTRVLNCTSPRNDSAAELSCLRSIPFPFLNKAAWDFSLTFESLAGIGTFRPTAPSSFVPDAPSQLLARGQFQKDVDIMVGWNENDATQFVPQTLNGTEGFAAFIASYFPGLSQPNADELSNHLYPVSDFSGWPSEGIERNFFRAAQVVRDAHWACPSLRVADAVRKHSPSSSVYMYVLNQTVFRVGHAEYNRSFVGQDHFSDVPYVFDYVARAPYSSVADQADYDLASHMGAGSWPAFARFGRPTVPGLSNEELVARNLTFADWTPAFADGMRYASGDDGTNQIGIRVLGGPGDGMKTIPASYNEYLPQRCSFWGRDDVLAQTWM